MRPYGDDNTVLGILKLEGGCSSPGHIKTSRGVDEEHLRGEGSFAAEGETCDLTEYGEVGGVEGVRSGGEYVAELASVKEDSLLSLSYDQL